MSPQARAGLVIAKARAIAGAERAGDVHYDAVGAVLRGAEHDGKPDPLAAAVLADPAAWGTFAGDLVVAARRVIEMLDAPDTEAAAAMKPAAETAIGLELLMQDAFGQALRGVHSDRPEMDWLQAVKVAAEAVWGLGNTPGGFVKNKRNMDALVSVFRRAAAGLPPRGAT